MEKTNTFKTYAAQPLPEHIEPPKPMTAQELEAPAPTPVQLKETLRRVLAHVMTPARQQHLVHNLYECARKGDKWASQLLFDLLRGAKEHDSQTVEQSDVKPLTKKQCEEELAKLGFISVAPQSVPVKQVNPDPAKQ